MKTLWWSLLVSVPVASFAQSAQRFPGTSYRSYLPVVEGKYVSAWSSARRYKEDTFTGVTSWPAASLQDWFVKLRDERFLKWHRRADFPRRLTWLYPQDGCFARADAGIKFLGDAGLPKPKKIFAFGDLAAATPYARSGKVSWWYHVAPVVDVDGVRYVLDPSVEAKRPLTVKEWIVAIAEPDDVADVKVSVCEAGAVYPKSVCNDTEQGNDGVIEEAEYEDYEWDNLKALKLDPEALLGENPPW